MVEKLEVRSTIFPFFSFFLRCIWQKNGPWRRQRHVLSARIPTDSTRNGHTEREREKEAPRLTRRHDPVHAHKWHIYFGTEIKADAISRCYFVNEELPLNLPPQEPYCRKSPYISFFSFLERNELKRIIEVINCSPCYNGTSFQSLHHAYTTGAHTTTWNASFFYFFTTSSPLECWRKIGLTPSRRDSIRLVLLKLMELRTIFQSFLARVVRCSKQRLCCCRCKRKRR